MVTTSRKNMVGKKSHTAGRLVVVLSVGVGVFIGACSLFEYEPVVIKPLSIPGAEYVGPETCAGCHEAEYAYFNLSDHATVAVDITDEEAEAGQAEACETCHGPGSLHLEEMGDKSKIITADAEACFSCHLDIKGKFMLQHHHPVPEGHMFCSDCHTMHGKDVRATGGELLLGQDEKCFKCHKEQRGPFIFEHDAMRDGCQVCHNPHGSIYDKLLMAGQTTTCIRCHWQETFNETSAGIGGVPHAGFAIGQGQECIDCHGAPHGSNIWRTFNR
ncbi:MAG: cytochrome c3 family protein [Planctomycetota bacterium]